MAAPGPEPTTVDSTANTQPYVMRQLAVERKRQGLTQASVAQQLGVSQTCVSQWESGHRSINLTDAERYAQALGVVLRARRAQGAA